jgi:alpha-beta hydrolase superfamily lysophospholipase
MLSLLTIAMTGFASVHAIAQQPVRTEGVPQSAPAAQVALQQWPATGAYRSGNGLVFVGPSSNPPAKPQLEFYDSSSRRWGDLVQLSGTRYRSRYAPYLTFDLTRSTVPVMEDRHVVTDRGGRFGYSLWHAKGAKHRPLIVLIHGADDSTRAFGFLAPYFVAHGLDVMTYDQRGTGESAGNWRYTSPIDKADDIAAALRQLQSDPAVNAKRVGVWGPSNGGWVAPLVAKKYPLAFMILKSAPSETIAANILYEIHQVLLQHGKFSQQQIGDALRFETNLFHALATNCCWAQAKTALAAAKTQPWYPFMRIPPSLTVPPPASMLAALRNAVIYDPRPLLEHTTVPTLALFGARDRNVDAASSEAGFREYFHQAGMRDFTVHVFPDADHLLVGSRTGYVDEEPDATKFARGYPDIMVGWLAQRGFGD